MHPSKTLPTGVPSSSIYRRQDWEQPRCLSVGEWTNCGTFRQWNIIQCSEEMRYRATKRNGETLDAYDYVNKASLKGLPAV